MIITGTDLLTAFGIFFILIGFFLLLWPQRVVQAAEARDRLFNLDRLVYAYRFIFGPLLIAASIYFFTKVF